MSLYDGIVAFGAFLTVCGLITLVACIVMVARARRAGLEDDALRKRMHRALMWNMAAVGSSAIGLMLVVLGVVLG